MTSGHAPCLVRPKYTGLLQGNLKKHTRGVREWQIWIFQQRLSFLIEKVRKGNIAEDSLDKQPQIPIACVSECCLRVMWCTPIKMLQSVCIFIAYFVLIYSNFSHILICQLHHIFANTLLKWLQYGAEVQSCWQALEISLIIKFPSNILYIHNS